MSFPFRAARVDYWGIGSVSWRWDGINGMMLIPGSFVNTFIFHYRRCEPVVGREFNGKVLTSNPVVEVKKFRNKQVPLHALILGPKGNVYKFI